MERCRQRDFWLFLPRSERKHCQRGWSCIRSSVLNYNLWVISITIYIQKLRTSIFRANNKVAGLILIYRSETYHKSISSFWLQKITYEKLLNFFEKVHWHFKTIPHLYPKHLRRHYPLNIRPDFDLPWLFTVITSGPPSSALRPSGGQPQAVWKMR